MVGYCVCFGSFGEEVGTFFVVSLQNVSLDINEYHEILETSDLARFGGQKSNRSIASQVHGP